ncbi:MAG: glycosyltransferase family 4 protein [Lentisphaerae bacterium]|nr:glycosyltransferase family 4 protein [Lentisphaerota bacterium]
MKKPRVALLHYSCPPVIGGVEFIIRQHYALLTEHGFPTRLIVGAGGERGVKTTLIPEMASDGGPLHETVAALRGGRVPDGFDDAVKRTERALVRALRGVDVCLMHNVLTMHFNLVLTAALARIMARTRRIHFVGWNHDSTFTDPNYAPHQRRDYPWNLLTRALPGCRYCAISRQRQQEISRLFGIPPERMPAIPDGVDVVARLGLVPEVRELYRAEQLYRRDLVALTPTRIVRRKNLEAGLRIVAALKRRRRDVRWIITGAPDPHNPDTMDYYRRLRAERKRLRIEKEVVFMCERSGQRVNDDALRGLFAVSNLLLFPSEREGFGIPVLEAGLARLLVVVSDIPAFREVGGRDAVYFRPRDAADKTAQRILRAFDADKRLTFRNRILSHYAWESVFENRILPAIVNPEAVWP